MNTPDPKQIPPPGFVAAQSHDLRTPWPDRGQGERGVMPAITDHGVTELVQSAPQPPEQGEAEPKPLQAAAAKAIDAMRTTQRLCNLPDGHLLASAERALDAALRAIEDAEQSSNPLQLPPHQSAAEWVWEHIVHVCDDGGTERMITEDDALELACRCDEAKVYLRVQAHKTDALRAQLAAAQADAASWKSHAEKLQAALDRAHQAAEVHQADYLQRISAVKEELTAAQARAEEAEKPGWRQSCLSIGTMLAPITKSDGVVDAVREVVAELARLQHESTAHRMAWENAEAREKELREDAERFVWLAQNGGGFAHDEGSRGISTHKWGEWASGPFTVNDFRRGIDAARAALAKHKEAQP